MGNGLATFLIQYSSVIKECVCLILERQDLPRRFPRRCRQFRLTYRDSKRDAPQTTSRVCQHEVLLAHSWYFKNLLLEVEVAANRAWRGGILCANKRKQYQMALYWVNGGIYNSWFTRCRSRVVSSQALRRLPSFTQKPTCLYLLQTCIQQAVSYKPSNYNGTSSAFIGFEYNISISALVRPLWWYSYVARGVSEAAIRMRITGKPIFDRRRHTGQTTSKYRVLINWRIF